MNVPILLLHVWGFHPPLAVPSAALTDCLAEEWSGLGRGKCGSEEGERQSLQVEIRRRSTTEVPKERSPPRRAFPGLHGNNVRGFGWDVHLPGRRNMRIKEWEKNRFPWTLYSLNANNRIKSRWLWNGLYQASNTQLRFAHEKDFSIRQTDHQWGGCPAGKTWC